MGARWPPRSPCRADRGPLPPNEPIVRALLALDLYIRRSSLHYAQKAWALVRDPGARSLDSPPRAPARRINAMKRAYPQYLAAAARNMPTEILKVLYPVTTGTSPPVYSTERDLEPVPDRGADRAESTFTADVNVVGERLRLMQLLPSTGRQYARALRLPARFLAQGC